MNDDTEPIRRRMVAEINAPTVGESQRDCRARLEAEHGQVWNTEELTRDFEVLGFAAPLVVVRRRADGKKGSLCFTHSPRFYFGWDEHKP